MQLEQHSRVCFRKKLQPRIFKQRPKHPIKLHIWGGISVKGATRFVMFSGIMNTCHLGAVYEAGLVPFIQRVIDCTKTVIPNIPQNTLRSS